VLASPPLWLVCCAAGASAITWLFYFRFKDSHRPEPLWMLLVALAAGAFAVALAFLGYGGLERVGRGIEWDLLTGPRFELAVLGALGIGMVEEGAKLLPVLALALTSRHFDERLDGLVYAGCAGTGFAAAETVLLAVDGGIGEGPMVWARVIAAPATHALFASVWGAGLPALAFERRASPLLGWLALSALAHGGYDLLLARPEVPSFLAAGVVLGVWAWFIWVTPRLARHDPVTSRLLRSRGPSPSPSARGRGGLR
jgi:RsiW-degrading membrane proteinase PrsW (M82 family)